MKSTMLKAEDVVGNSEGSPESWCCVDCGWNTNPGSPSRSAAIAAIASEGSCLVLHTPNQEVYTVTAKVWRKAGNIKGCLCIGCLEARLGRYLRPKDFDPNDGLSLLPGSERLRNRRGY